MQEWISLLWPARNDIGNYISVGMKWSINSSWNGQFIPADSPGLRHVMYFRTNGKAYQVFNCNVETHEDWMKTLRDVDIIYPSGPEGELRIMYELAT